MTSKERFLAVLNRKKPDRLPVTTHHVMPYFLSHYMNSISYQKFFDFFGIDPINWVVAIKPDTSCGDYFDPAHSELGFLEPPRICSPDWQIELEEITGQEYKTIRYNFMTPQKKLSMVLQSNEFTSWVSERLVKEKADIDLIARFAPAPLCDIDRVNKEARNFGSRG